jgi:hypothetical protein
MCFFYLGTVVGTSPATLELLATVWVSQCCQQKCTIHRCLPSQLQHSRTVNMHPPKLRNGAIGLRTIQHCLKACSGWSGHFLLLLLLLLPLLLMLCRLWFRVPSGSPLSRIQFRHHSGHHPRRHRSIPHYFSRSSSSSHLRQPLCRQVCSHLPCSGVREQPTACQSGV